MRKSFNSVLRNHGCLECSGLTPKTPEDYHRLASTRGFKWLGREVPNAHTDTEWTCGNGHTWEATFSTIQENHGCPDCLDLVNGSRVSIAQRRICGMVGGELNAPFRRYRIDIAKTVGDVKIAIEYDSWFFHGRNREHDRTKDQGLLAYGWRIRSPVQQTHPK